MDQDGQKIWSEVTGTIPEALNNSKGSILDPQAEKLLQPYPYGSLVMLI